MEGDSIELVHRFRDGDRSALDELLERHLPRLRGCVRLHADGGLRRKEDSTDIVQSLCREILEQADRFQHPGEHAFRHWLYSTALRKILKRQRYYRAQRLDVDREVPLPGAPSPASPAVDYAGMTSPSVEAMARETRDRIEAAFERLSDEHRQVLVLAQIVGLSREEIGRELGRSENAVRSLLFRARARLGTLLAQGGIEEAP